MKPSLDLEIRLAPDLLRRIERAGQQGLKGHVQRVFDRSQSAVPVDTGALKESGRVERIPRGYAIAYGHGPGSEVDYAVYVHEDVRFLANPAIGATRTLPRDMATAIAVGVRQPPLREVK